jgi:transposase
VDRARALKLQVGAMLREQRVKMDAKLAGGRWSRRWVARVRDNAQFSEHVRWIVGELLDDLHCTQGKIAQVEGRLRQATKNDAVVRRLLEQEGIGEVTAWVLRAYVGNFDRFAKAKQLARYCGMSPCNASTGQKQADAGLIDGCNKLLRATVVQAAQRLRRTSRRWSLFAEALERRGKPTCVIVAAVGNRWLRHLHHAMKDQVGQGEKATMN